VLFYSDDSINGTGFLLSYVVSVNSPLWPSHNFILNTEYNEGVDFVRGPYENNELSTILHVAPLPSNFTAIYRGDLMENCLADYIRVYKLQYGVYPPTDWIVEFRYLNCNVFGNYSK